MYILYMHVYIHVCWFVSLEIEPTQNSRYIGTCSSHAMPRPYWVSICSCMYMWHIIYRHIWVTKTQFPGMRTSCMYICASTQSCECVLHMPVILIYIHLTTHRLSSWLYGPVDHSPVPLRPLLLRLPVLLHRPSQPHRLQSWVLWTRAPVPTPQTRRWRML